MALAGVTVLEDYPTLSLDAATLLKDALLPIQR